MNESIKQKWIDALESFSKDKALIYNMLLFPMKMSSTKGDMYSPLGLLCDIHAKETKTAWDIADPYRNMEVEEDEKPKKKKKKEVKSKAAMLPTITGYIGSTDVPPVEVLKWADIKASECSNISRVAAEKGFEGVVQYLKKGKMEDILTLAE